MVGREVGVEDLVGLDVGVEVGLDVGVEVSLDVAVEVSLDDGVEVSLDVAVEVGLDVFEIVLVEFDIDLVDDPNAGLPVEVAGLPVEVAGLPVGVAGLPVGVAGLEAGPPEEEGLRSPLLEVFNPGEDTCCLDTKLFLPVASG
ncbi:hypothetical protein Hanom_Chr12g01114061 [Helianthus anomalus]